MEGEQGILKLPAHSNLGLWKFQFCSVVALAGKHAKPAHTSRLALRGHSEHEMLLQLAQSMYLLPKLSVQLLYHGLSQIYKATKAEIENSTKNGSKIYGVPSPSNDLVQPCRHALYEFFQNFNLDAFQDLFDSFL